MKKIIDSFCPPILVLIGIIILLPPKPEPICPACGTLFDLVFSKAAAVLYIGVGAVGTYFKIRESQMLK